MKGVQKKWRKCILSCLMGLIFIHVMINLDIILSNNVSNLFVIEILKVSGWMLLWNGLQTFVYEILFDTSEPFASDHIQSKTSESNNFFKT